MSLKKSRIILLAFVTLLSCHGAPGPEITTVYYYHNDILHGKVKQVIETYRAGKSAEYNTDTTYFDVYGNAIQTKGSGYYEGSFSQGYYAEHYNYKYTHDQKGTRIRLVPTRFPDSCNYANGRVVEMDEVDTNSHHLISQVKHFFKYNAAGNRIVQDDYTDNDYQFRRLYNYNDKHLLTEEEFLLVGKEKRGNKMTYRYISFDLKGNWLERKGKTKVYGLELEIPEFVEVRKVSYY